MLCSPDDRRPVRHSAGALRRVSEGNIGPLRDFPECCFLEGDAGEGCAVGDFRQHISGAFQKPSCQLIREPVSELRITGGSVHGHKSSEAGAGPPGIREGNLSPELFFHEILPRNDLVLFHQLGVVDQHDRQCGEGGPDAVLRPVPRVQFPFRAGTVREKKLPVGLQAFHAAAEHDISRRGISARPEPLQEFVGAALDHIDPDPGLLLKFPDHRPPDLLPVRGKDHQAVFRPGDGDIGKNRVIPRGTAASGEQHET